MASPATEFARTIVVDLDGTLVLTDTLASTLLEAIRRKPLCILSVLKAFLRGPSFLKHLVASFVRLDPATLPYNRRLLEHLRSLRARGCRLVLATGADRSIATDVANHLAIFDDVIATSDDRNVTGDEKVRAIRQRIGDAPFTYVGNSRVDLKVWRHCRNAVVVNAPAFCLQELRRAGVAVEQVFAKEGSTWAPILRCLRPHQWSKNSLVFVALVLSHQIANVEAIMHAIIGFVVFCLLASGLYVVNDLLDLQADRMHPEKRQRPLACGDVSIGTGVGVGLSCVAAAIAISFLLPAAAGIVALAYAIGSFAYSIWLKRTLFLDVVSLALLYGLRVLYGGAVTGIRISVWTLVFSLFIFISLATVKRLGELRKIGVEEAGSLEYRAYKGVDTSQLSSLAAASGFVAVLVLALYINSPDVGLLYNRPRALYLLCPLLIYWVGRIMLLANRGELDYDPVAFALQDKATWLTGFVVLVILTLSTLR